MKWISLLTSMTLLSLRVSAQVPLGNHTIKSGAVTTIDSLNPWVQARGAGMDVVLVPPFQGTPDPKTISWTISDIGNGQVTIFNNPSGYATFVAGPGEIPILTDPNTPTAWTITPQNVTEFGHILYTISAPLSSAPNSPIVLWTKHDSTSLLFADLANDPSDSIINRWWQLV